MDLTKLTSGQFERIVALLKEKEQLSTRLAAIEGELNTLQGVPAAEAATGRSRRKLSGPIIAELQKAGAAGLTVPALAERLNCPNASIHMWFNSTAKNNPQVEKVGRAQYRWKAP